MQVYSKVASRILNFSLIINSAIILFPDKLKGVIVVSLLASSIFCFISEKHKKRYEFRLFLLSISFFVVLVISIFYSENISYALKKLETSLSLLAYPLAFSLLYNCRKQIGNKFLDTLKIVFVVSLTIFLVSTFTYYFLTEPFYTFKSTIVHYHTLADLRIKGYEIHSIYLSMYVGVGILFSIDLISKTKYKKKTYNYICLIVLFAFLAILNKKGPVISMGLIGLAFIIKNRFKIKTLLYITTISAVFILTLISIPKFKNINRFYELIDIENLKSNPNSSTALRLSIYKCSYKQALKSPILGYGWGDAKEILNDCYKDENPNLLLNNYNSHNQFLGMVLSTGLIGLLVFLYYFYSIFNFSNKNGNKILFYLLLYFGFNMLSENILEREDGVILFAFFINLFLFNSQDKHRIENY